ncbi:MAG: hypothetical protein ACPLYX_01635 [Rectinema subterraneum]|uniref:hypothetical protein n=1 Tax=Rectinema subterraneum TaxID=2653714 RepID=UPI003C7AB0D1
MRKPFEIATGAWWIVPDGRTIAVPSFHESWLASHPAIASGCLHTVDFVQKSGWLSVTLYSEGMIEIISRDISDARQREAIHQLFETNKSLIKKIVVFQPSIEGCLTAEGSLVASWEHFVAELDGFLARALPAAQVSSEAEPLAKGLPAAQALPAAQGSSRATPAAQQE